MLSKCIEAAKLYEKDPKLKRGDVTILQEWLQKQPHLPSIEESQIIFFLHSCYYKIERAKITIDNYFSIRTQHSDLFRYQGEEVVKKSTSVALKAILPRKTPEGYLIFAVKLFDHRSENFIFFNEVAVGNLASSLYFHQNGFGEGVVAIFDLQGFSLGHLARMTMSIVKIALEYIQECIPIRIKGVHVVNAPSFIDKVLAFLKPFMANDLFNMIQVHTTVDSLYKDIPKECLPEDQGGQLPSFQTLREDTKKYILNNLDFFKWHDSQIVDESKRIEKSKYIDSTFGMDGTFKKLELD